MIPSGFVIFFGFLLAAGIGNAEMVEIVTPETISTTTAGPKQLPPLRRPTGDSYLEAYMSLPARKVPAGTTHFLPDRRRNPYNTIIRSSLVPRNRYPSLTHQGHWMQFRRPPPRFGPPPRGYRDEYGYFPPPSWDNRPYSSPPFAFFSLLFPKKSSLKLVLTVVLKLILFAMLVKFIAVVCLLFFIPALKSKETSSDFDDEVRKSRRLDAVSNLVWNGIDGKRNETADEDEDVDGDEMADVDSDSEDETDGEDKPEEESDGDEKPDVESDHGDQDEKEDYSYEEEELKDIKKIVDLLNKEPSDGPYKLVRMLRICITAFQIVVNIMRSILMRRNEEGNNSGLVFG